jgi:hypothetical protein
VLHALLPLVLARLDERFALDQFIESLLAISYESERRGFESGRAAALFAVEREHYRRLARELLADAGCASAGEAHFIKDRAPSTPPRELARRMRRSRRRALERWPKYLITFDGWIDYALAKLERAGRHVTLSPRQQRHPLLFAWPALYRLARDGVLR